MTSNGVNSRAHSKSTSQNAVVVSIPVEVSFAIDLENMSIRVHTPQLLAVVTAIRFEHAQAWNCFSYKTGRVIMYSNSSLFLVSFLFCDEVPFDLQYCGIVSRVRSTVRMSRPTLNRPRRMSSRPSRSTSYIRMHDSLSATNNRFKRHAQKNYLFSLTSIV